MPSFGIVDSVSRGKYGYVICYCGADQTDGFYVRVFEKRESRKLCPFTLFYCDLGK